MTFLGHVTSLVPSSDHWTRNTWSATDGQQSWFVESYGITAKCRPYTVGHIVLSLLVFNFQLQLKVHFYAQLPEHVWPEMRVSTKGPSRHATFMLLSTKHCTCRHVAHVWTPVDKSRQFINIRWSRVTAVWSYDGGPVRLYRRLEWPDWQIQIDLLQKNECLWKTPSKSYSDRNMRQKALSEMSAYWWGWSCWRSRKF